LNKQDQEGIAFNATADADAHALFWFVNDAYVGRSPPGESLFWQPLNAGHYDVRVVDDHGRSDHRPLDVSMVEKAFDLHGRSLYESQEPQQTRWPLGSGVLHVDVDPELRESC
jgi:hypothetical protein